MNHHAKKTWILVAHRSHAVIYESHGPGAALAVAAHFENERGRLKPGEIDSDRPGRAFDRVGGGRHAMSTEEGAAERVEHAFVLRLVHHLEHSRSAHAFDRMVLIAPPKMLGKLRDALSDPLSEQVIATLAKDLAHSNADDVRAHLTDVALV